MGISIVKCINQKNRTDVLKILDKNKGSLYTMKYERKIKKTRPLKRCWRTIVDELATLHKSCNNNVLIYETQQSYVYVILHKFSGKVKKMFNYAFLQYFPIKQYKKIT